MEVIVRKEMKARKTAWLVEAGLRKDGKPFCSIYKGSINPYLGCRVWHGVPKEQLVLVPASVLKANAAAMKKVEAKATGKEGA